jgi:hypothetical protein
MEERALGETEPVVPPLYCSLFGLSSVDDVRTKLLTAHLQDTSPQAAALHANAVKFKKKLDAVWGIGGAIGKGVGGVIDIASGAASEGLVNRYLQDRLIVLDDLERRADGFGIVAILGFIEALRVQRCQVLVIFNEEKIADETSQMALASFREKVFDIEIELATDPRDAFQIAYSASDFRLLEESIVERAMVNAEITNIRIAKRALAAARHVFAGLPNPADGPADDLPLFETMRAIAVSTNIFYGGVKDAPSFPLFREYVLATLPGTTITLGTEKNEVARQTLERYFPSVAPFFLGLLFEHLQTGNLLMPSFCIYWAQARVEQQSRGSDLLATQWLERFARDVKGSADKLAIEANEMLPSAPKPRFGI